MIRSSLVLLTLAASTLLAQGLNPVHWSFSDQNVKAVAGQTVTVHITAEIESEWHLYGLRKIEGGPIATTLTIEKGQGFEVAGDVGASPPITAEDPSFGVRVDYYLGRVHFELPVRVAAGTKPGTSTLKVLARYQMCNDSMCLPPKKVNLELPVTIEKSR